MPELFVARVPKLVPPLLAVLLPAALIGFVGVLLMMFAVLVST
jgi:hypothetical protein